MVLIFNKESFFNLTRCLLYYFVYSYKIYQSFNYKNATDKIAGKYPGWELET